MKLQFSQFGGLDLHFTPDKQDMELGHLCLQVIEQNVEDPVNREVAKYFQELIEREFRGGIQ